MIAIAGYIMTFTIIEFCIYVQVAPSSGALRLS